jgi:hypothetical protein
MKFHYYIILFFACSCFEKKSNKVFIHNINLNNNLILLCDSNFKILMSDKFKDHGKVYNFFYLSNDSNETIMDLSYSLKNNRNYSWCNVKKSELIKYKIAFIDGLPTNKQYEIKNVQIDPNFKIGGNCFVKFSYPQVQTWLLGTTIKYSFSIIIYNDTNDIYLNTLKGFIE